MGTSSSGPHPTDSQAHRDQLHRVALLAFSIECTKPFRKLNQLFVADQIKGLSVSLQRISSWITSCIQACYELAKVPAPALMAHSTKVQAASVAFLPQVLIQEICRMATWPSVHTFTSHYAITQHARDDSAFGRVVLQSAIP